MVVLQLSCGNCWTPRGETQLFLRFGNHVWQLSHGKGCALRGWTQLFMLNALQFYNYPVAVFDASGLNTVALCSFTAVLLQMLDAPGLNTMVSAVWPSFAGVVPWHRLHALGLNTIAPVELFTILQLCRGTVESPRVEHNCALQFSQLSRGKVGRPGVEHNCALQFYSCPVAKVGRLGVEHSCFCGLAIICGSCPMAKVGRVGVAHNCSC